MSAFFESSLDYLTQMQFLEMCGLVFGLLAVLFLIKENSWTWPFGIMYVLCSFVVFWQEKLYADFALHIFFLILNIYGWWYWIYGTKEEKEEVAISTTSTQQQFYLWGLSIPGIFIMGLVLNTYTDASLPYWDSATTTLSLIGMWLTARKKIENWHFWLVVDVLATGIYFYKDLYFYSFLYLVYIGMAIAGFLSWKKSLTLSTQY